ncbi:MAG: methylmalonyl-CoA mutase, partial [Lentisphaeraceae bacterium]|nr:methylmalonyl-CoA mutase [Lentisphaeraceae bacterium]
PGFYPFTAGVFPFKRQGEAPTRMFAGEGHAEQTNARFHFVSKGQGAARLSTAFDSVTLYGADPDKRADIYGKVGNAGVSICSLDDMKRLYSGFDLCAPTTSVSMTINGPAPAILAYYFDAAIDAAIERKLRNEDRWPVIEKKIKDYFHKHAHEQPVYRSELPDGHDGSGLGFLGLSADDILDKEEYDQVKADVLSVVRGTVQADILKEDQAQNTCIFSTEFAMKMMGDVQQYFIDKKVRNFYSVSISGYHIAEAGATPITQLAFTLANGFTLQEYYKSRGMNVSDFAPNLSFFFSNGMDPEYSVIGRVARRIWAIALKNLYGADERSQKLKYHIQTSGRSLHAQEVAFNDIRTTLQALYAIMDNCNSLHTNAYDEALTTPTEESVRRAIAIQMIINHECGLTVNENPLQGSYFLTKLTNMVEDAVLEEFLALDARGGVLGAMESMYQRSKIQEESMAYEHRKHSGDLKIVGVNFWCDRGDHEEERQERELRRSSSKTKDEQVQQVSELHQRCKTESNAALNKLKKTARHGENIFTELMETAKYCSLGEISEALFEVGGAYRRNM